MIFITRKTTPEVAEAQLKSWRHDKELKLAAGIARLVVAARKGGLSIPSIARVMKLVAAEVAKLGAE